MKRTMPIMIKIAHMNSGTPNDTRGSLYDCRSFVIAL
jgi:hypothetical protein